MLAEQDRGGGRAEDRDEQRERRHGGRRVKLQEVAPERETDHRGDQADIEHGPDAGPVEAGPGSCPGARTFNDQRQEKERKRRDDAEPADRRFYF